MCVIGVRLGLYCMMDLWLMYRYVVCVSNIMYFIIGKIFLVIVKYLYILYFYDFLRLVIREC